MGTSTRNISLAAIAAVLFHAFLLCQTTVLETKPVFSERSLRITISEQKEVREQAAAVKQIQIDPKPEPEDPAPPVNKPILDVPPTAPLLVDSLIIESKPVKDGKPKVVIQTSLQSANFKQWLRSETENHSNQNLEAVGEFNQSFDTPLPYKSPKALSVFNGNPVPRGGTTFSTENNGRRTCYVKMMNLLDISSGPTLVSKDCTPKSKFDLRLNKPNNG
jgi:hypothetical protein